MEMRPYVEYDIPIKEQQGEEWHSFQMTVVVDDFDEPEEDSSRVVWRGSENVDRRNIGYGHFVRSN